jgi:hypothetical protein
MKESWLNICFVVQTTSLQLLKLGEFSISKIYDRLTVSLISSENKMKSQEIGKVKWL